jgi:hypothetical protein
MQYRVHGKSSEKSKVALMGLTAPYSYLSQILSKFKYRSVKLSFLRISRVVYLIQLIGTYLKLYLKPRYHIKECLSSESRV